MQNEIGNGMQWLQLIITIIGLITIFIKIGHREGEQTEKNKHFSATLQSQSIEIKTIKTDISDIKEDIAYIRGKLL